MFHLLQHRGEPDRCHASGRGRRASARSGARWPRQPPWRRPACRSPRLGIPSARAIVEHGNRRQILGAHIADAQQVGNRIVGDLDHIQIDASLSPGDNKIGLLNNLE